MNCGYYLLTSDWLVSASRVACAPIALSVTRMQSQRPSEILDTLILAIQQTPTNLARFRSQAPTAHFGEILT